MQNKGVIRLLAILLALASLYQLSFTWVTSRVRGKAVEYANGDELKEAKYLDSIGSKEVYNFFWIRKYTYKECLERELNFGLDLKGGMNVILEISVPDVVVALSNNNQDPAFVNALRKAKEDQKNSQEDFITLFGKAFEQLNPNDKLASIFTTETLKGRVNFNSTNEQVIDVLKEESIAAIDNCFMVLSTRIDRLGVVQPNIQRISGQTGRILVELPGVKDPERVKKMLQGTANLEFWKTYDVTEIWSQMRAADAKLKTLIDAGLDIENPEGPLTTDTVKANNDVVVDAQTAEVDTTKSLLDLSDSTLLTTTDTSKVDPANITIDQLAKQNPLFAVLRPITDNQGNLYGGAAVGFAHYADTAKVNKYLSLPQVADIFPRDLKFLWCVKSPEWDKTGNYFELVAIRTDRGNPCLTGEVITNAREEFDDRTGSAQVSMTMNGQGAKEWARITKDNVKRQIAVVLDNLVYSFPTVQNEITGGNSQITGNFTVAEAKDLATILKSGKLPAPAKIIEEEIVGPSLGQATINQGMWSFIGAFIVILLYMVVYYRKAGFAASLALICNIFFLFGVLASVGAVLTLPGIAGIVLTMGMAVDANVIIFERVREELHAGKGLKLAVKDGYSNSYSAIIDGNVTTILTGIILYIFGHGPIQGFATTLVIGILTTLFSAIFITRLIFTFFLERDKEITFWSKWNEFAMKNTKINFIDGRKTFFLISGVVIVLGIGSMAIKGFDKGVDFLGGRTYVVKFDQTVATNAVASTLAADFGSAPLVKTFGSDNQVKIITKYRIDDEGENVDTEIEAILYNKLLPFFKNASISKEHFMQGFIFDANGNPQLTADNSKETFGFQSSSKVGPTIADDIMYSAILAIVFALIVMFIYIFIRFHKGSYGISATVALCHDVLFVLGIYSLFSSVMPFSMEIDQSFIAAILTIVGYSINDTVVVFDRIREFVGLHPKSTLKENMNGAINSTLSRTVNTSLTTFFVLLVIFIFGGEVIRGFVFALLLGTVVGTYSSVCIASPLAYEIMSRKEGNPENEKK
ncbi:MAG: protein translocase subunit SecDF [Bacteroidales bacterium]|nr:protein translocase subunit SecDF [Bacteroidales bacterium]